MRRELGLCALLGFIFAFAVQAAQADAFLDTITFNGSAGRISSQTNINNCAAGTDWTIGGVMCVQGKLAGATNQFGVNVKTGGELDLLTSGAAISSSWTGPIYTAVWGPSGAMQILGKTTSFNGIELTGALSGGEFVADCSGGDPSTCLGTLTFDYTTTFINQAFWTDLGYTGTPPTLTGTVSLTAMKIKINSPATIGSLSGTIHSTSFETTVVANPLEAPSAIPEPATLSLLGTGMLVLGAIVRHRKLYKSPFLS